MKDPSHKRTILCGLAVWTVLSLFNCYVMNPAHPVARMVLTLGHKLFLPSCLPRPWDILERSATHLACAAVVLCAACVAGSTVLKWFGRDMTVPRGIAPLVGLGLFSQVLLGLGLAGLWFRALFWLIVVICLAGFQSIRRSFWSLSTLLWHRARSRKGTGTFPSAIGWMWAGALISGTLIYTFIANLAPEAGYDAIRIHLYLAGLFQRLHKVVTLDRWYISDYPLAGQMLLGLLRTMDGDTGAKLLLWLCLLGLGMLLVVRSTVNSGAALVLIVIGTTPLFWVLSTQAYVDMFRILFTTAMVIVLMEGQTSAHLVCAGYLCGVSLGVKYFSGIEALAALCWIAWNNRGRLTSLVPRLLLFLSAMLLAFAPWCMRCYVSTGDPVFPFLQKLFRVPDLAGLGWSSQIADIAGHHSAGSFVFGLLAFPWNLIVHNQEGYPAGAIWLVMFGSLFAYWSIVAREEKMRGLMTFALAAAITWFAAQGLPVRYGSPIWIVLAILGVSSISAWETMQTARSRLILRGCFLVLTTVCFMECLCTIYYWTLPISAGCGCMTTGEYMRRRLAPAQHYWNSAVWANVNLPAGAHVLIMGDTKGYYWNFRTTLDIENAAPWMQILVKSSASPEVLRKHLKQRGITHLWMHLGGTTTMGQGREVLPWTDRDLDVYQSFWRQFARITWLQEIAEPADVYAIYTLSRPPEEQPMPRTLVWPFLPYTETILLEGDRRLARGDAASALNWYGSQLHSFPSFAHLHHRMALAFHLLGRSREEREHLGIATRLGFSYQ